MTPEDTSEHADKIVVDDPTVDPTNEAATASTAGSTALAPSRTESETVADAEPGPTRGATSRPDPTSSRPRETRGHRSAAWWVTTVTITLTALGVVIALIALLNDLDALPGGPLDPPPAQTTPAQPPPEGVQGDAPVWDLFDDFSAPEILSAKWRVDDPSRYFRANQGGLEAAVTRTSTEQQAGTMTAQPGQRITGVTLDSTILAGQGPSEGGLYIILIGESGQQRRVSLGPGSKPDDPIGFGVESCPTATCDSNVLYAGDGQLEIGRTYPVSITVLPDVVVVDVGGVTEPVRLPAIDSVRELRLYATTNTGASFTVKVDNVRLDYPG